MQTSIRSLNYFYAQEQRMQLEREKKKIAENQRFVSEVLMHSDRFRAFHREKYASLGKIARAFRFVLETFEKDKEREHERQEKARLRALKENDMEAYMQLVSQTKNQRLKHLLQQTDEFLSTLGTKVKNIKQAMEANALNDLEEKEELNTEITKLQKRSSVSRHSALREYSCLFFFVTPPL